MRLIESELQQQVAACRPLVSKNTTAVPSGVIPVANPGSLLWRQLLGPAGAVGSLPPKIEDAAPAAVRAENDPLAVLRPQRVLVLARIAASGA